MNHALQFTFISRYARRIWGEKHQENRRRRLLFARTRALLLAHNEKGPAHKERRQQPKKLAAAAITTPGALAFVISAFSSVGFLYRVRCLQARQLLAPRHAAIKMPGSRELRLF